MSAHCTPLDREMTPEAEAALKRQWQNIVGENHLVVVSLCFVQPYAFGVHSRESSLYCNR